MHMYFHVPLLISAQLTLNVTTGYEPRAFSDDGPSVVLHQHPYHSLHQLKARQNRVLDIHVHVYTNVHENTCVYSTLATCKSVAKEEKKENPDEKKK